MIEITEQDFEKEVVNCNLPVFACFVARWCQSCYPTCLYADQLASEYDGSVKFVKLDKEESSEIAMMYHVIVVPTVILLQDGQPVKRLLGFQDRRSLRSFLNNTAADSTIRGACHILKVIEPYTDHGNEAS